MLKTNAVISGSQSSLNWLDFGQIQNMADTIQIQHHEQEYLSQYETMWAADYNTLFSWKDRIQQWQLWDCYLVSWIIELSKAQHFDTLMRTSIQRMRRNNWDLWYQIKIPFWEPSWRKILIKDSELKVAKINWANGFKLLELAYAKNRRKNDRAWNQYAPITSAELQKISWWWTHEVLQTYLWKQNIWFNDFWTQSNFKNNKVLDQSSQKSKDDIKNFLKHYNPKIWNKFVSLASKIGKTDHENYKIGWKTIYCKHAYSISKVEKTSSWDIKYIRVLNPRNQKWDWKNYLNFTLDEFYKWFSAMQSWTVKVKNFLDNKSYQA